VQSRVNQNKIPLALSQNIKKFSVMGVCGRGTLLNLTSAAQNPQESACQIKNFLALSFRDLIVHTDGHG